MAWRARWRAMVVLGPVLVVLALAVVWLRFRTHERVLAVEQIVLARWLRPAYLGGRRPRCSSATRWGWPSIGPATC
jgi:hypothetical protein